MGNPKTRREKLRHEMMLDIKLSARRQMTENGTAAISLSAIARELEVSQPALYRYYASRDDLVTALILDAFNDLADTLEQAAAQFSDEVYGPRLLTVIIAYRQWAMEHPIDFQLIYGNPIPGYHAPSQVTAPASARSFTVILGILARAYTAGALKPQPEQVRAAAQMSLALPELEAGLSPSLPKIILYLGIIGWYRIHGIIMLELFHHIQGVVNDTQAFYQHEVELLLKGMGLDLEQ
jgi:AcrR family transcriptional regulator